MKTKEKIEAINLMQKDDVRVATVLDTRRPANNGLYYVKTRVTFDYKQKYYTTGTTLTIDQWQRLPKARDYTLAEIRRSVEASAKVVHNAILQLCELNSFSFERLDSLLGKGNKESVNTAFKNKIQELIDANKLNTAEFYQGALNAFVCFKCGKWCGRREMQKCTKDLFELTFQDVTAEKMQRFEKEALAHGYTKTTIAMRMRAMRTICNVALRDGVIRPSDYCFKKGSQNSYTIKKTGSRKIALTLDEIKIIAQASIKERNRKMSRDLFLFSFWANGINFADLIRLKWSDYNRKTNEFTFVREKTKNTASEDMYISFPLFPTMKDIIDEWGSKMDKESFVFSFLKGGESYADEIRLTKNITYVVNSNIKKLIKSINADLPEEEHLPENVSTYTARHSYGTILAHNRVPESYIGFALGHSSKSVTDSYIEEYSKEDRIQYNSLLQF
ncbi:site-specific integrase [Dysgonomonas sp. HDW5B]|uniref:tyrosine-type recombinase/integrase n=1 Tax=Dysgonomonas sp. HDW5B TaxID=2714927 RepID=UPI00140D5AFB|nr:tyrosine-type recombinase/integrase [Dysgonomonas sp. HDW5B]QIK55705.1 site-specific integrase [Dysgonomonas sp. HDW5B]